MVRECDMLLYPSLRQARKGFVWERINVALLVEYSHNPRITMNKYAGLKGEYLYQYF